MHNLHLVIVAANTVEDAYDSVSYVVGKYFEGENNWYELSGAVAQNGTVFVTGEGRFAPEATASFASINTLLTKHIADIPESHKNAVLLLQDFKEGRRALKSFTGFEWYCVKIYVEAMQAVADAGVQAVPFDVLQHTYREYEFDTFGLTSLQQNENEAELFIVYVDMHS